VPAYVVLQLTHAREAKASRLGAKVLTGTELRRLLAEHGGRLLPPSDPHPRDEEPPAFTTIAVPDMARANKLAAALRSVDGIETAFAKPGEELP